MIRRREIIQKHKSSAEALKNLGNTTNQSGICAALNGRKANFMGFVWKYADAFEIQGEIWKNLPPEFIRGSDGYCISSEGRLKDRRGNIRIGYKHSTGYLRFCIGRGDYLVHVLVVKTFLPNFFDLKVVNHKNGDKTNPRLYNLHFTSNSYNTLHAHETGLIQTSKRVYQITLDGQTIVSEHASIAAAARATKLNPDLIGTAAKNHSYSGLFRWEFVENIQDGQLPKNKLRSRAVRQISLDGKVIRDFPSTDQAAKAAGKERSVFRKSMKKTDIIAGFRWLFI